MIVADTHAFVWWVADPERLGVRAARVMDDAAEAGGLGISAVTVWEVATLVARGRLELTVPVREWIERALALPGVEPVPVDERIVLEAVLLPGFPVTDPADRMIVATARTLGVPLVTRDRRIAAWGGVETVW